MAAKNNIISLERKRLADAIENRNRLKAEIASTEAAIEDSWSKSVAAEERQTELSVLQVARSSSTISAMVAAISSGAGVEAIAPIVSDETEILNAQLSIDAWKRFRIEAGSHLETLNEELSNAEFVVKDAALSVFKAEIDVTTILKGLAEKEAALIADYSMLVAVSAYLPREQGEEICRHLRAAHMPIPGNNRVLDMAGKHTPDVDQHLKGAQVDALFVALLEDPEARLN